jgi:uncharacterized membrane protein YjfL (UPF0719 family)
MKTKILFLILGLLPTQSAFAAALPVTGIPVVDDIFTTFLYSAIGILTALVAFKAIDALTPGNLSEQIANNNIALGIVVGFSMLGVCLIIAASIAG